ncbi:N-acetylmuramoyl-L-alanine amidase [Kitasatospora sp. A2-31]|uniref:N-acetylmuramoyl-L-alanine amidase n=1 Tax=Kitasatospora sp. A2-31 TaxID=2916414 RepID=UPI001EE95205|nr:N-acetylmuramoyl-L-alanine amidase [Kitasatospora sp. A2-31]MCG6493448.1 N-acetylmuramoyl-L-alanine amidase [Kitasatospora sp. A2-31]
MAWYPGAQKLELQPESDQQPAIRPTQLILHSIAAPWTPGRIYEYWRDSTNLESHFGLGYDGSLAQFIGTETRADANMHANLRADGTGAVSLESASNLQHTDPWTDAQIATIIRLGVWLHQQHGIPLRVCRSATDPGFGYHRLFPDWSDGGTACPGDARVRQFHDVIMPGIIAAANGQTPPAPAPTPAPTQEDDMPLNDADKQAIREIVRDTVRSGPPADRDAYADAYLLAYALAGEAPPGASDDLKNLCAWYHQAFQSCVAAVVDNRLAASALEEKVTAAVSAAVGPAVAQALGAGLEITITPKGN